MEGYTRDDHQPIALIMSGMALSRKQHMMERIEKVIKIRIKKSNKKKKKIANE